MAACLLKGDIGGGGGGGGGKGASLQRRSDPRRLAQAAAASASCALRELEVQGWGSSGERRGLGLRQLGGFGGVKFRGLD